MAHAIWRQTPRYVRTLQQFNLRAAASAGSELKGTAKPGESFRILSEKDGEETVYGDLWYKVSLPGGGTAWLVASQGGDQQLLTPPEHAMLQAWDLKLPIFASGFETGRQDQLAAFPEQYREALSALLLIYPEWHFEPVFVKDPWKKALAAELSPEDKNLVQYSDTEYFEPYAWMVKHKDRSYDGDNWYAANEKAVAYFLNPLNFLNPRDIFQFLDLRYGGGEHRDEGVRAVFAGNDALLALTPYVMEAAREADILPEALASRMRQEISSDGGISFAARGLLDPSCPPLDPDLPSPSFLPPERQKELLERLAADKGEANLSKELREALARARRGERAFAEPKTRYYNLFNIGAYPDPEEINGAAMNAARFAAGLFAEKGSARYKSLLLPWTSQELAARGGAKFLAGDYVGEGQDTPYFQKFDVVSGTYSHQYMQAVFAARDEGRRLCKVWTEGKLPKAKLRFRIPVYRDLPVAGEGSY